MGDCCQITLTFHRRDLDAVCFHLGIAEEWILWEGDIGRYNDDEVNYAMYKERESLAHAHVSFYGSHGAGDNYQSARFVAHQGVLTEVLQSPNGELLCIFDEESMEPQHASLVEAKRYVATQTLLRDTFAADRATTPTSQENT